MSRPTIPPSGLRTPTKETVKVLQRRLAAAEEDSQNLVADLTDMGFDKTMRDDIFNAHTDKKHIEPYTAHLADPVVLEKNYETIISRVCKLESAIQTLKLNLLRTTAERDLSKKEKAATSDKMRQATEIYEMELQKVNRETSNLKKENKRLREERQKCMEDVKRLQGALDIASSNKSEVSMEVNGIRSSQDKLKRKLVSVQQELSREVEMRASLEESHNTLLQRIKDTEDVVTKEHSEVQNMNTTCSALKRDLVKATEHANREEELRKRAEEAYQITKQQSDLYATKIKTHEKEKELLESELGKLRGKYHELDDQLDKMYKVMQEKKDTQDSLEKENKNLYSVMKNAASQNAELISKYEEELENARAQLTQRLGESETLKYVQEKLKEETREKAQANSRNADFEEQVEELSKKANRFETELNEKTAKYKNEIVRLKEKLKSQESEMEEALKDKENLLDEVNQAVDSMTEEREQLVADLEKVKVELGSTQQAREHLEDENTRLLQRLGLLEEQQSSHQHVQSTLDELQAQKGKLAYDKGRLQSRVEQLQRELESLANGQMDSMQNRKQAAALESKLQQTQSELNSSRMMVKRLEAQLEQMASSGDRKEGDFSRAIKVRDEALKEAQKLQKYVDAMEGREKMKLSSLHRNLEDSRGDSKKMAAMLEGLMGAHAKLQSSTEGLQQELGRKDALVSQLEKERSEQKIAMKQLEKEIDNLQSKLVSMETIEAREVHPLRQALQKCKTDNAKLACSLEAIIKSNESLQVSAEELQNQVEKKTHILEKLQQAREKDQKEHKKDIVSYEERLANLKESLVKERDRSTKKSNKDVAEVRKQIEDLVSKNGDLSRTNSDLRHKITELEYTVKDQKEKLSSQKSQIEHLSKVRQKQDETMESMKGIGEQLAELENMKNEYTKKNEQQSKTIQKFMKQITSLQSEVKMLAETQAETANLIQQQEKDLTKERKHSEELRQKYRTDCKRREAELEEFRVQTANKLQESANESLSTSHNLNDAHDWFKGKFDGLQNELVKSRKSQQQLEKENFTARSMLSEERRNAEETAKRAREMIQTSRETISRLADYAESIQSEKRDEFSVMQFRLEAEREQSKHTAEKLQEFQESSFRHTEQLARELDYHKALLANS